MKVQIANVAVIPMLLVNVADQGKRPRKFPKSIKKNSVSKYGTNFSYPLPIVDLAISSLTNRIKTSKKLANLPGIRDFLYFLATIVNNTNTSRADNHINTTCFVGVISIPNINGN